MQSKPLARVLALRRWHVGLIVVLLLIPLGLWCSCQGSLRRKPAALRLNPADREMRKGLVMAFLRLGSHQQARNEFNILLQSHPPADHEALKKWFAEQAR